MRPGLGSSATGLKANLSRSPFDLRVGAPAALQGVADATWGNHTDLYALLITMHGGAVFHQTKKVNVVM